ncbi:hypothetical protein ACVMB1_000604 [Bradyrhizobium sp. USDA 4504]
MPRARPRGHPPSPRDPVGSCPFPPAASRPSPTSHAPRRTPRLPGAARSVTVAAPSSSCAALRVSLPLIPGAFVSSGSPKIRSPPPAPPPPPRSAGEARGEAKRPFDQQEREHGAGLRSRRPRLRLPSLSRHSSAAIPPVPGLERRSSMARQSPRRRLRATSDESLGIRPVEPTSDEWPVPLPRQERRRN